VFSASTLVYVKPALATQHQPQPADDPQLRDVQRERLTKLRDELVAEGADGAPHLTKLQACADTWPE
jgi:hypothetical protein